jgi:hypothetical protein
MMFNYPIETKHRQLSEVSQRRTAIAQFLNNMQIYSVNDLLRPYTTHRCNGRDPVSRVSPRESENGVRTGNTGRELALITHEYLT